MLNEVKHLANVSCQITARDPSDATLCQDDTQRGEKTSLDNSYIIAKIKFCDVVILSSCEGSPFVYEILRVAQNDTLNTKLKTLITMKVNWKQVLKIVITVLTALAGALGVASCAV